MAKNKKWKPNPWDKTDLQRFEGVEFQYNPEIHLNVKVGDILIEEYRRHPTMPFRPIIDKHGLPYKYKVVHIGKNGPYMKRMAANGRLIGSLRCIYELASTTRAGPRGFWNINFAYSSEHNRWVPDPDVLDSILLDQTIDPLAEQSRLSTLKRKIREHNHRIILSTWRDSEIYAWAKDLKPNDIIWNTHQKFYVVEKVDTTVGLELTLRHSTKQTSEKHTISSIRYRRLYREQPRSFAEESKQ